MQYGIEFNQEVQLNKIQVTEMTFSRQPRIRCGMALPGVLALMALLALPVAADARGAGGGGGGGNGAGGGSAGGGGGAAGNSGGHAGAMGMGGNRGDLRINGGGGGHRAGGVPTAAGNTQGLGGRPYGGYVASGPVAVQNFNIYGDRPSRDNEGPYFPEYESRFAPRCFRFGGPHCPDGSHLRYGNSW